MRDCSGARLLVGLVLNEGNDHLVEVKEEHEQVETELDEGLLLMNVQLPKDLGCVQQMRVLDDPTVRSVSHLVIARLELQSSGRIACSLGAHRLFPSRGG